MSDRRRRITRAEESHSALVKLTQGRGVFPVLVSTSLKQSHTRTALMCSSCPPCVFGVCSQSSGSVPPFCSALICPAASFSSVQFFLVFFVCCNFSLQRIGQRSVMVRRAAVVGAGSSGLACIKICVDEGLEPVCFESSDDIGGMWRFKESPVPEQSSIYRSLVVNTSKEMMCFSDFPMPAEYPNYMHHSQLLKYFRLYAEHFQLLRYINFQTTVRSVTQRPDFSLSGQWDIVTINRDGEEERHVFDAVLVCKGPNTHPVLPLSDFPGHETFSGRCLHSWEYKDADACRGKRVVVVGIGNSGGDIAVEISRSADKTFLSTRQGAWVMSRASTSGLPVDMTHITRLNNMLTLLLPKTLVNWTTERALNHKYDHGLYGLKPRHRFLDQSPLINDDLPGRILQGAVVMRPNLKGFVESGVVFEDGTVEGNIDAVLFCTGYIGKFPFLPPALSEGIHEELILYKRLFPPSLQHPTLAIVGHFRTKGPVMPIVEMQARWAVKVFSGLKHLPSKEKMLEVIETERQRMMKSYPCPRQAAFQVDYIPYLDFMAKEVGVLPNLLTLLLRDPQLWVKVFFGPCTPYQYRLTGPGQWAGARHAILSQWKRVAQPFKTRAVPELKTKQSVLTLPWLLTFGGSVIMAVLCLKLSFQCFRVRDIRLTG
ncbi:flavin-containing monooxygenase 5 isoform X1 [Scophthalmus maximus]|nr:flavin-containing monooxygenase 5 isoform X1 [Scophthalmus maximus]